MGDWFPWKGLTMVAGIVCAGFLWRSGTMLAEWVHQRTPTREGR